MENNVFNGGLYVSIALNKLRSAVTNYKFKNVARSCCAVQVDTVNIFIIWLTD